MQVLVDEQGGQVADDKTETDKSGEPLRARMVLRVPVDSFEDVMNALGSMETLASTTTSSEDVTTQLIDVEARIKAQQASVERVRQLLAQAQSIRDIMAIESELAQRQAELDSLAQQQAYLKDQTSMATVKVNIERKPDPKAAGHARTTTPVSSPASPPAGTASRPPWWPSPPSSVRCCRSPSSRC